jgi:hypothetical protein
MKCAILVIALINIALPTIAEAACCDPNQYYNWAQVRRQNEAQRQRGVQQQQRACQYIRSSRRVSVPSACR